MAPETVSSSSVSPITTIVAELAIELNITLKNNRLYGEDHPVVASNIRKVLERLARGFSYQSTIPIHFTRKTIIFGENFLSKTSPIYQQLAGSMWHAGILGITIEKGVTSSDINRILTIVNELTLARKRLDDVKDQYKGRMPEHIHFDLISKDLFVLRQKDQVSSVSKDEETGLWEDFIFSLGAGGTASDGESPISRSVMELAKKISSQAPTQKDVVEYDQAVVSYLKGLDRSHREQGILSQTDLGKKIGDFIAHINPELRQQILCATLTTPDLSETMIQEFSRVVDYDYLVDSLKALNAQGRALPVTVYRTLSIVGLLGEEEDEIMGAEDDEINLEETEKENFQALLDTLLTEDNRFSYMSQEYEAKIESLQAYAEELARSQSLGSSETYFERGEIEKHFVGICSEIMDRYPEDIEAASSAGRQVDKAFAIFLDRTMLADCFQCIVAGKRAAAIDPKRELFPYTWEKPEVQDLLLSFLSDSEEDNRTYARMILATIGKRVLDKLVPLLVSSQEIGVRRQAVNILTDMEESPSLHLLDLFQSDIPWYAKRNIIYIFRKRQDPSGQDVVLSHWKEAHHKVQTETIRYLFSVRNKDWLVYLKEAIFSKSKDLALGAARMVIQVRWDEVVQMVVDRIEQLPRWAVGSSFHLDLVKLLLQSRNQKAKSYVTASVINKRGVFSWQTARYQENVRKLMKETRT